jgi:methylmalonyl-CoA/ethylmalonyl-CoA epimerase
MKFHHIGVATNDLKRAIKLYSDLGYNLQNSQIYTDQIQKVKIAFMKLDGHPLIELVTPNDIGSPIDSILNKKGSTPYHTCYEVSDLLQTINDNKKLGFTLITKLTPAIAFNNRSICFMYNKDVGMIELLEEA